MFKSVVAQSYHVVADDFGNSILHWYSGKFRTLIETETLPVLREARAAGFITKVKLRRVNALLSKSTALTKRAKPLYAGREYEYSYQDFQTKNPDAKYEAFEKSPEYRAGRLCWRIVHSAEFGSHLKLGELAEDVEKLKQYGEKPAQKAIFAIYDEWQQSFSGIVELLKTLGSGISDKDVEKYLSPTAGVKALEMVEKLITEQLVEVRPTLLAHFVEKSLDLVKKFKAMKPGDEVEFKQLRKSGFYPVASVVFSDGLQSASSTLQLLPDYKGLLSKKADSWFVTPMVDTYQNKMIKKLATLMSDRKDLTSGETQRINGKSGILIGAMVFKFANGDGFNIETSTKINQSIRGKLFLQVPSVFTNVTHNGKTFSSVSEKWMNEQFAKVPL